MNTDQYYQLEGRIIEKEKRTNDSGNFIKLDIVVEDVDGEKNYLQVFSHKKNLLELVEKAGSHIKKFYWENQYAKSQRSGQRFNNHILVKIED